MAERHGPARAALHFSSPPDFFFLAATPQRTSITSTSCPTSHCPLLSLFPFFFPKGFSFLFFFPFSPAAKRQRTMHKTDRSNAEQPFSLPPSILLPPFSATAGAAAAMLSVKDRLSTLFFPLSFLNLFLSSCTLTAKSPPPETRNHIMRDTSFLFLVGSFFFFSPPPLRCRPTPDEKNDAGTPPRSGTDFFLLFQMFFFLFSLFLPLSLRKLRHRYERKSGTSPPPPSPFILEVSFPSVGASGIEDGKGFLREGRIPSSFLFPFCRFSLPFFLVASYV